MSAYNNHVLGFTSVKDFITAVFGTAKKYNMKTLLLSSFTLAGLVQFIEVWVWSPAWTLLLFWLVYSLDFAAAVSNALHQKAKGSKGGFNTQKAIRFVISIICATVVLIVAHMISIAALEFGLDPNMVHYLEFFPIMMYWTWVLFSLFSAIRHLSAMGIIPKPIAKIILKYIDSHKTQLEQSALPQKLEEDGAI